MFEDDDEDEHVYEDLEFALEERICPKCGRGLNLAKDKGVAFLRCPNVRCRWECSLFGSFEPFAKRGGRHVFGKSDLVFLKACASVCMDCEFLCWCDVHKFYCRLGLPLTTFECSRLVVRR